MTVKADPKLDMDSESDCSQEDFSDDEDFVDDIKPEDVIPELLAKKPSMDNKLSRTILVDGLPIVKSERLDRLKDFIKLKFAPFGEIEATEMPVNSEGSTLGCELITFKNVSSCHDAIKQMNNVQLDAKHTYKINFLTDYERFLKIEDTFQAPEMEPFCDLGYYKQWCMDSRAREQLFVLRPPNSLIFWNSQQNLELLHQRDHWSDRQLGWSPLGTFLYTLHRPGVILWAGATLDRYKRFEFPNVLLVDFSPDEKHLVAYSIQSTEKGDTGSLMIYHIETGKPCRPFEVERVLPDAHVASSIHVSADLWPILRWSHDGRYFARMVIDEMLSVYDSHTGYGLLDKRSISVPGIKAFSWSPASNLLAYWVAETNTVQARVVILELPSKKELTVRILLSVANISLHWQGCGDFLCVKIQRYSKKKVQPASSSSSSTTGGSSILYMGLTCDLEIFHVRDKETPVDKVEMRAVPNLLQFEWEPQGQRFAYLAQQDVGNCQVEARPGSVPVVLTSGSSRLVFGVQLVRTEGGSKVEKLIELDGSKFQLSRLAWSPKGQFLVVGGRNRLEWWDMHANSNTTTSNNSSSNESMGTASTLSAQSVINTFMMSWVDDVQYTDFQWDPSGRYLCSWTSSIRFNSTDVELAMWSCVGRQLHRLTGPEARNIVQVSWRPRPRALLSDVDVKRIKKNLKKYSQKFEVEDKILLQAMNKTFKEKRIKERKEFMDCCNSILAKIRSAASSEQVFDKMPEMPAAESIGLVEITIRVHEMVAQSNSTAAVPSATSMVNSGGSVAASAASNANAVAAGSS